MKSSFRALDRKILLMLQKSRRPWLNKFFIPFTFTGTGYAWFTFAGLLQILHMSGVIFTTNQIKFLNALFSPLVAWILSSALKRVFARRRPAEHIEGFELLIQPPKCGSFPSGHTASAVAFVTALIFIGHPLTLAVGVWAALIIFSRMYLGVHYFSDILGGTALGIFSAYLASVLVALF